MILLSNTAALCKDRAEGSGAVSLQLPPTSSISVLSRLPPLSLDPPVTRSTCMIMIKYVCIHNWNKLHNFSLISQIGPTGVIKPSNIELRQNLSLSSPAVSRHSLQRRAKWIFIPSRDDVLASSCNATGIAVKNKLNIDIFSNVTYDMPYCRGKLAEDDKPSELTNSVEPGEYSPPISKVEPSSPSTSQQRWPVLSATSMTEVGVKDPVRWFSLRQDRVVDDDESTPPQSSLPQCVW